MKNYPYWHMRTLAGIIFTVGMLFFVYNVLHDHPQGARARGRQAGRCPGDGVGEGETMAGKIYKQAHPLRDRGGTAAS